MLAQEIIRKKRDAAGPTLQGRGRRLDVPILCERSIQSKAKPVDVARYHSRRPSIPES